MLAGDVDLIENVPIQDLARVRANPAFKVVEGLSNRVIYLHFNYLDEPVPGVADTGGKNPFRDRRVREAISKAIDRDAIVARIMGGVALAAGELLPPVLFGANRTPRRPRRTSREPRSCWPRPAIRTASRWCSARPTTATSTTR